jgi:GAF domain-containing protein
MQSFIRVSTAIAAEMSLESLLKTLMKILLETSGAERCCILLANQVAFSFITFPIFINLFQFINILLLFFFPS